MQMWLWRACCGIIHTTKFFFKKIYVLLACFIMLSFEVCDIMLLIYSWKLNFAVMYGFGIALAFAS